MVVSDRQTDALSQVERLLERSDVQSAAAMSRSFIEASGDAVALLQMGRLLERFGLINEARLAYERSLLARPRFVLAQTALGIWAIKHGDSEEAVLYLKDALEEEPDNCRAMALLGVALLQAGEREKAIRYLRRVIELDPGYEEAYYNLGTALRDEDPAAAYAAFEKTLDLDPSFGGARREMGYVLLKLGRMDDAEEQLAKAIADEPNDAWAHVYWGTLRWLLGDVLGAAGRFGLAIEAAPEQAFPLWSAGALAQNTGEMEKARHYYEAALRIDPTNPTALEKLLAFANPRWA